MASIKIKLPAPHSDLQKLIMQFFSTSASEMWVANATKWGKTLASSTAICSAFPLDKQALSRWIAPQYSQAKIGFNYCKRILPVEPITQSNLSDLSIKFPSNDTKLQFFHGQKPEALEGEAVKRYIFDEAAKMKEENYSSAKTTMTFTKGQLLAISTPLSKNWFYKKWIQAKEEMEACLRKGILPTKYAITAPTSANPFVDASAIAEAKRNLPDRLFRQYYLAEFVDDGSVFIGVRQCLQGLILDFASHERQRWVHSEANTYTVCIGADWAKTSDFTVFTAWEYVNNEKTHMVGFDRFQGIDYKQVMKELYKFCRRFAQVVMIFHDKTGLGTVLDDLLEGFSFPFEGITFSNDSKSMMVNKLMVGIQREEIILPHWPEMINELDSYEVTTNQLGRMIFSAPQGLHDDIVSSMMLGYSATSEYKTSGLQEISFVEELQIETSPLETWYNDLIEDDQN